MDLSSDYIKMCNRSEEIQREHRKHIGDFIYRKNLSVHIAIDKKDFSDGQYTWLPRIDQLQELLEKDNIEVSYNAPAIIQLLERLDNKRNTHMIDYWHTFDTLEKLWLAIYMYDFYDKIWNRDDKIWEKN